MRPLAWLSIALLSAAACHSSEPAGASGDGAGHAATPGRTGSSRVTGEVLFRGPVPAFREPAAPFPECGQRTPQNPLRVREDGRVADAFVYVKEGLPPGDYPLPAGPVLLDQKACDYHPRVFGIRAGQPLVIRNSDDLLHNVHARGAGAGLSGGPDSFNVAMPVQGATVTRSFPVPQVPVAIGCDVHPWMRAYAGVVSNPFFAVTGDDGTFSLDGLPAGAYVIEAWQERLGRVTASVTLGAAETQLIHLELKP
jgi:hypothetical protein